MQGGRRRGRSENTQNEEEEEEEAKTKVSREMEAVNFMNDSRKRRGGGRWRRRQDLHTSNRVTRVAREERKSKKLPIDSTVTRGREEEAGKWKWVTQLKAKKKKKMKKRRLNVKSSNCVQVNWWCRAVTGADEWQWSLCKCVTKACKSNVTFTNVTGWLESSASCVSSSFTSSSTDDTQFLFSFYSLSGLALQFASTITILEDCISYPHAGGRL